MRLEHATISLAPRTTANCLDVAVRFFGAHLTILGAIWLFWAGVTAGVLWGLHRADWLGFGTMLLTLFVVSSPLGVSLGIAAIPTAFGEPMTGDWVRHRLKRQAPRLMALGLLWRVAIAAGMAACLLPGGWIAVRSGFFVEQDCLKRLDRSLHDRRVKDLVKGEMSDLLTRGATIALFAVVVWLSLLLTLDRVLSLLFSVELLTGRMFSGSGFLPDPEAMFDLVASDLRLLTVIAAIGLLVYAVGRLAWFFCYVDLRVRRDCWDMELRFTQEARRLQAAGSPHPERVSP